MDIMCQQAARDLAMSMVHAWRAHGQGLSDPEQLEEAKSQKYEKLLGRHDGPIPPVRVDNDTEAVFQEPTSQGVRATIQGRDGWWQHEPVFRLQGATGTITDARELAEHCIGIRRSVARCQQAGDMTALKNAMDRAVTAEEALVAFVREHGDTLRGPEHKVDAVRRWLRGSQKNIPSLVRILLIER